MDSPQAVGSSRTLPLPLFVYIPFPVIFSLQGEQGPTGPPGPPGEDGPRVSSTPATISMTLSLPVFRISMYSLINHYFFLKGEDGQVGQRGVAGESVSIIIADDTMRQDC